MYLLCRGQEDYRHVFYPLVLESPALGYLALVSPRFVILQGSFTYCQHLARKDRRMQVNSTIKITCDVDVGIGIGIIFSLPLLAARVPYATCIAILLRARRACTASSGVCAAFSSYMPLFQV